MINLFIRHSRHFNTAITLISQTVDEFISETNKRSDVAAEKARRVYNLCDIMQAYHHKTVSDAMVDAHHFMPAEQTFIATAQFGENSTYSERLLSVGNQKKSISVHVNDFERHVLDDDLDSQEYLIDQGHLDASDAEYLADIGQLNPNRHRIPATVIADAMAGQRGHGSIENHENSP